MYYHSTADNRWQWVYLISISEEASNQVNWQLFWMRGKVAPWKQCAENIRPVLERTSWDPSLVIQLGRKGALLDFWVGPIHNCLCFWKFLATLFFTASSNRFSVRESLSGFRVKVLGLESSSAIFVPKKKIPPPLRLELSGGVSCTQIYLASSTNEIKLPLYQGLDCGEQNIILFIASQALSLILTSRSVLRPKSTSTMRAGAQVELQQTNFT